KGSRKRLVGVILTAVVIGFGFFAAGIFVAKDVVFNIFPPTKDSNQIGVTLQFPAGTTIDQASAIAAKADKLTADVLGANFVQGSYYNTGDAQGATLQIELTPYSKRDVKSPELVKQLQERFDSQFTDAKVIASQIDVGPPGSAFNVQIDATDRQAAYQLA